MLFLSLNSSLPPIPQAPEGIPIALRIKSKHISVLQGPMWFNLRLPLPCFQGLQSYCLHSVSGSSQIHVEINVDRKNEKRGYAFRAWDGVSYHHWHLAEIQRHSGQWESFVLNKRQSFRCALTGICWHVESGRGLN